MRRCSTDGPLARRAGDHDGRSGCWNARSLAATAASALARDPRFDPCASASDFNQIVGRAGVCVGKRTKPFRAADGPRLLGLPQG
jgi:hypothetical protein